MILFKTITKVSIMTTELELLFRWLNSSDNRKESEQNFTAYYNVIGKRLYPYMENRLRFTGNSLAEEIFPEIMVKICTLILDRPQVAKRIEELMSKLEALDLNDPFFKKRTYTWSNDVNNWARESISFNLEHAQTKSPELDGKVKIFNDKKEPLEEEGKALLDWLANKESHMPWKAEIIDITDELFIKKKPKLLSKIRIPTNAMLFLMAKNKITDHWRKKSTQTETALELDWDSEDESTHGSMVEADSQGYLDWVRLQNQGKINRSSDIQEAVEFLLQAPIRKAETELHHAMSKQEILRSENRLDKACSNYIKHLETLEMMKAEYTQEEIAVNLSLTRDQVRTLQTQIKALLEPLKGDLS